MTTFIIYLVGALATFGLTYLLRNKLFERGDEMAGVALVSLTWPISLILGVASIIATIIVAVVGE